MNNASSANGRPNDSGSFYLRSNRSEAANIMNNFFKFSSFILLIVILSFFLIWNLLGPVNKNGQTVTFIIPQNKSNFNLEDSLFEKKLIRNKNAFVFLKNNFYKDVQIKDGGYYLNPSLTSWQIIKKLSNKQDLMWVNIYFCPRKEQVGEKLANTLGWNQEKLDKWNNLFKGTEYYEGVFYPDTYLIPVNETVEEVAQRFIQNFGTRFSTLSNDYIDKNIKWTTGLKIASLIAREAAGRDDMHLISGVIWNRLNQDMRLQIDATMQYTLGKDENGSWWGSIDLEQKRKDSPYNSYLHEGLPPTPICSPNIEYIEAALNPSETDCIFYLHDKSKKIYCSKTYQEHKENIKKYL